MKLSKDQVDKKIIGDIVFGGLSAYKMKRVLMNGKTETIQLAISKIINGGVSLIALPNGNLFYGARWKLLLLNEIFQEIKRVSTDGDGYCALNHRNELYVSDQAKHCITLFDLNLNQLKQFGSFGTEKNQFINPYGLCCHGDFLYICEYNNMRIKILTLDFDYVNTIQLDGNQPFKVQISNTTIGVSCEQVTLFYDLVSKKLKYKHNIAGTFTINYIDSIFCALNVQQKKIYLFDSDGNFLEEKAFHDKLILSSTWYSGSMCRYKDQLYMADKSGQLIKFLE